MMSKYIIEIFSRGYEVGIGKITKEQHEYWVEREDDLGPALHQNIDYDAEEVPEDARFEWFYNDYSSEAEAYGADANYSTLIIKDEDENEIFNDEISVFINEDDGTENNMEYISYTAIDDLAPGYYVYWEIGGKGQYFHGEIELEKFDPKLLTFKVTEVENCEVITSVHYDGAEVDNYGGDWWGKYEEFGLYHIEEPEGTEEE